MHKIPQCTEGLYPTAKWDLSEDCKVRLAYENQSTDTEKAPDKIPHTFMVKIFNKLRTEVADTGYVLKHIGIIKHTIEKTEQCCH